jgi:hypothetical protein
MSMTWENQPPSHGTMVEAECKRLCDDAGAVYIGIQSGYGITPDVLLFQVAPGMATTLALRIPDVTPRLIREKLMDCALRTAAARGDATFNDALQIIRSLERESDLERARL